jgi:DnaK suppressor protein
MTDTTLRNADLRRMLSLRRYELQNDVQGHIRDRRTSRSIDVRDTLEQSDADFQGDIESALIQMRAETLIRIDAALVRLDAGEYGSCVDCADGISERRLRALPFAVRCQGCAERHERAPGQSRQPVHGFGRLSLFPDLVSV